jgi:hypothetical protein
MQRTLTDWEGEFEELLSREDELLANPEVCEKLFASNHEAFAAGCFIGERSKHGNASATHATATVAGQTSHPSEPAERLPDALSFDLYSDETFEQFKARVHESLSEINEREYDDMRYASVRAPVDEEGVGP